VEKEKHVKIDDSDKSETYTRQVEGVAGYVPYKGLLSDIVDDLIAGIRSGLSYGGARNIPQLWQNAKFIRITNGGLKESNAHDVILNIDPVFTAKDK
jgi:IMP dehydrogenase